jgi:hypothetical protein
MSILTPVNASRAIGLGRIGFGIAMLAVPAKVGESWLGEDGTTPAAQVALRGLGIRDLLIGMAQVHTAADPERGYRWARTSGIGDAVDLIATVAAAKGLPRSGVYGTGALAGLAVVSSIATSEWMRREG